MNSVFKIECVRSASSMFGMAVGLLKSNGVEQSFPSFEAAQAEAKRLNERKVSNVSYHAIELKGFSANDI
jgi:hypothetical protein